MTYAARQAILARKRAPKPRAKPLRVKVQQSPGVATARPVEQVYQQAMGRS